MKHQKTDRPRSYVSQRGPTIVGVALIMFVVACARAAPGDLILTIPAPGGEFPRFFGYSMAALGDDLLIGAPRVETNGRSTAGSAYFVDGLTGELHFELTNPAPTVAGHFGWSVAAAGGRLAVGATLGGSVYTYDSTSGDLLETIRNPGPRANVAFGQALAMSADTIVIGDHSGVIGDAKRAGTAYQFDAVSGDLQLTIPNPRPILGDFFGDAVAVFGSRILVGAPTFFLDSVDPNGGRVFVIDPATGETDFYVDNPNPLPGSDSARFGNALSTIDNRIIVGAPYATSQGVEDAGMVYTFNGVTGELELTITNPEPHAQDQFGHAVESIGGYIVVGAHAADRDGLQNVGTVYVFQPDTGELLLEIPNPDPQPGVLFGTSLADLNGDIVVGALGTDEVYLFEGLGNIVVGDADADGDVDIDDLNRVRNHFGKVGPDDGTLLGDTFPYDGAVGIDDLNRIRNHFGNTRHPTSTVPEPASVLVFSLGILALAAAHEDRRHRRPEYGAQQFRSWHCRLGFGRNDRRRRGQ